MHINLRIHVDNVDLLFVCAWVLSRVFLRMCVCDVDLFLKLYDNFYSPLNNSVGMFENAELFKLYQNTDMRVCNS